MNKAYQEMIRSLTSKYNNSEIKNILGDKYNTINKDNVPDAVEENNNFFVRQNNNIFFKFGLSLEVFTETSHWLNSLENSENTYTVLQALLTEADSVQNSKAGKYPYFKFTPEDVSQLLLIIVERNKFKIPIPTKQICLILAKELNRIFNLPRRNINNKFMMSEFIYWVNVFLKKRRVVQQISQAEQTAENSIKKEFQSYNNK